MKRLLVDIDDTLKPLVSQWLQVYNFYEQDNLKIEDITDYDIARFAKPGSNIFKYLYPTLYNNSEQIVGALWGVNELRSKKWDVVFVTDNRWNAGIKYKWLNRNGFGVDHKHYIECGDRSLILCDYLLDDNYFNILGCEGKGVLFTQNWNKKNEWEYRVNGWFDFVHKLQTGEL